MKEPSDNNEIRHCGSCLHYKLGILEIYCHRKDVRVKETKVACKLYDHRPGAIESVKKSYIRPIVSVTTKRGKTASRNRCPLVQPSNLAANLGTSLQAINQAVMALNIQLIQHKTGKSSRKHIRRTDLPKIKKYIIANGL